MGKKCGDILKKQDSKNTFLIGECVVILYIIIILFNGFTLPRDCIRILRNIRMFILSIILMYIFILNRRLENIFFAA